jgi:hypothetical protein
MADKEEAVKLSVSLSQAVMSASLGMLTIATGAAVALSTAVSTINVHFVVNQFVSAVCVLFFVASIFVGGRAIARSYHSGSSGTWEITELSPLYDRQAKLSIVGIGLAIILGFSVSCQLINVTAEKNQSEAALIRQEVAAAVLAQYEKSTDELRSASELGRSSRRATEERRNILKMQIIAKFKQDYGLLLTYLENIDDAKLDELAVRIINARKAADILSAAGKPQHD